MGKTCADGQKDDQNEGDLFCSSAESGKVTGCNAMYNPDSKTWNLVKGAKPGRTLILKLIQSETRDHWLQDLFLKRSHGLGIRMPKHLVSLDEKYLRRCLELIHMKATKGAPCALSVNLSSLDTGFMSDYVVVGRRDSLDGTTYAIDYPLDVEIGNLGTKSPAHEGIVGSIMGSPSMMNILSSPLFQRLGVSDFDARHGTSLFENKRCVPSDYQGSPGTFRLSSSQKPENLALMNQGNASETTERSPISVSSGLSLPTNQSSLSFPPSESQGMLQCTWENGSPHFAFSLDDQKELYVANAWKVDGTNSEALDYVYSFHLKPSGQKFFDLCDNEPDLLGKMKVSTSFSLCSNTSKIMETEFVLVGTEENHARYLHPLTRNSRRSRKLSRVMEVLKSGHSFKQRTPSLFGGTNAIPEHFSADQYSRPDVSENDFLPNLEMAAIVVKDHVQDEDHQKKEVGGWGLKFLKKAKVKQKVAASLDASLPSECSLRDAGSCSTSIDVIVPMGPHGGPRTRNGGPASLLERWRSGGHCDCGGWDVGCPLKVLKASPRNVEGWPSAKATVGCNSFELFSEGSEQRAPLLKMVNIHSGSYFIRFQSASLSALQCFSIAVAIVHSQSPILRPKHVQESGLM